MKCEKCNFRYCKCYEEVIYYCIFFGEDEPGDPFCTEDGCKLKYKEAEKLARLLENCAVTKGDEIEEKDRENVLDQERKAAKKFNEYFKKLEEKYDKQ